MAYPKMTVGDPQFLQPQYGMQVGQMSPMMQMGDMTMYDPGIHPITTEERIALDKQIAAEKMAPYIRPINQQQQAALNQEIQAGKWGQPVTKEQADAYMNGTAERNPFLAALQTAGEGLAGMFGPSTANASKDGKPGDGKLPEKSGVEQANDEAARQAAALQAAAESGKSQKKSLVPQYMRPALIGDYGLGRLAGQSAALGRQSKSRQAGTVANLEQAQQTQELALDAQADAQSERYRRVGEAKAGAVQAIEQAQSDMDKLRQTRETARQQFGQKMADAQLQAQYALMPLDQVKANQAIVADETADPRKRAAAKLALENARKASDKRSVGKRILGAIAAGLGAYAAAYTGGPNFALQMITDSINRDIQTQREQFGRAKGRIKDIENDFARNLQVFGDEKLAILETQRQRLMAVDAKVDEITSNMQGPELAAKREMLKGQLAEQIAMKTDQINRLGEAGEMQSIQQQAGLAGQRVGVARANQSARMQAQQQIAGRGTTDIEGLVKTGQVTQKQSDNVRQFISAQAELDSVLKRMIELRNKYGIEERAKNKIGMSKIAAELRTLGGRGFNVLRKKNGAGAALTESEERAQDPEGVLRDPLKVGFVGNQLEALLKANRQGIKEFLNKNNYDLADKEYPTEYKDRNKKEEEQIKDIAKAQAGALAGSLLGPVGAAANAALGYRK